MRRGNERQYRPTPITAELQIGTASRNIPSLCWSSFEVHVPNRWTSVLEYNAQQKRTRQEPTANYVQNLATAQNTEMNFLFLHCYGGLLQHNHTGSPITVATSGYTNARENNGNRRRVVIKTRTRDMTYAWRQWNTWDTAAVFPWLTDGSGFDRYTSASQITGPIRLTRMNINHSAYIRSVLRRKGDQHCIHHGMSRSSKWHSCFVSHKFRVQIMARKQSNRARCHLLQSLHVNMRTVSQTRPRQILSHLFQFTIHYYPNTNRCTQVCLTGYISILRQCFSELDEIKPIGKVKPSMRWGKFSQKHN